METKYTSIIIAIISFVGTITLYLMKLQTSSIILLFVFLTSGTVYLVIKLTEIIKITKERSKNVKKQFAKKILLIVVVISLVTTLSLNFFKNSETIPVNISLTMFFVSSIIYVILEYPEFKKNLDLIKKYKDEHKEK